MRRLFACVVLTVCVALQPLASYAAWSAAHTATGTAGATTVTKATAPTVTRSGSTAAVSWPAGALANGTAGTGYVVRRTAGATTTTVCTTTAPTRSCVDSSPVPGISSYTVTNTFAQWSGAASAPTTFVYDTVAPTTSATLSPPSNAAGWNNTTPTLSLTATDALSGVASITYRVGTASAVTVSGGSATVNVATQATTTITYYAKDAWGNTEQTQSVAIRLDSVVPTASSSVSGTMSQGTYTSPPTVTLTGADTGSGVASITYQIGSASPVTIAGASTSVTVTAAGTTTIMSYSTDVAGNRSATHTRTVTVAAGPALGISAPEDGRNYTVRNNGNGSWARAGCVFNIVGVCGTANHSAGIDSVAYTLVRGDACWNGSAFQTGSAETPACLRSASVFFDLYWYSSIPQSAMVEGSYTFTVKVTASGGLSTTETSTFTTTD